MELALNNFEVLDQTQMQEIDGGVDWVSVAIGVFGLCCSLSKNKIAQKLGVGLTIAGIIWAFYN